ncbi:DUF2058 domain-containing protein [Desulfogranum mediterraneum]|uniref:DUF2058 domain-containing protein n=1 Tax=Desulfogranum mediterraneum TaxID=160661 RepID=UPI0004173B1E|nr:DUF2058 domain-containing protein [Desulfogranum mediterraneum]
MGSSLLDQLKKTGLVDEKKARQAKQEKHKQTKKKKGKRGGKPDVSKLKAQAALARKAARDRALNEEKKAAAEEKAVLAQVRQMVSQNLVKKGEGDIGFNFTHGTRVERIYVKRAIQEQLVQGRLAIVMVDGRYELVAPEVAEKIRQRHPASVIFQGSGPAREAEPEEDDPYAEFQVPDDLMW